MLQFMYYIYIYIYQYNHYNIFFFTDYTTFIIKIKLPKLSSLFYKNNYFLPPTTLIIVTVHSMLELISYKISIYR